MWSSDVFGSWVHSLSERSSTIALDGRNRLGNSLFRGSVGGRVGVLGRGWAVEAVPMALAHMGKPAVAEAAGVPRRRYGGTVGPALVARGGGVAGPWDQAEVRRGGGGVRAGTLGRQGCQACLRADPLWARSCGLGAVGGGRGAERGDGRCLAATSWDLDRSRSGRCAFQQ